MDQIALRRDGFKETHVEDGEFRNDSTDFLVESVLGELDFSHVDYHQLLLNEKKIREAHNS